MLELFFDLIDQVFLRILNRIILQCKVYWNSFYQKAELSNYLLSLNKFKNE
jgi:hypothetical protein